MPRLEFGDWNVGNTSQRLEAQLYNTGNALITVTAVDVAGDFLVRDTVEQVPTIPPGGLKVYWVWFRPTTSADQELQTASLNAPPRPWRLRRRDRCRLGCLHGQRGRRPV